MTRERVEKVDFYRRLIELMDQAKKSVRFYSISCCFGFYSFGVKNFECVLLAIRDRLKVKYRGRYLDVQVIVKIDPDNPMDRYAAQRLSALEQKYLNTGEERASRKVFRELGQDIQEQEMLQFVLVDDLYALGSEAQDEYYNEDLNLVLNVSQPGFAFEKDEEPSEFSRLTSLFQQAWGHAKPLDVTVARPSRRGLQLVLKKYRGVQRAASERDLQLLLTGYLQGQFDPSIIDFEATVVDSRIDLLVGPPPHHQRSGIELKYRAGNDEIDRIVGQVRKYRKEYSDLFLVIGCPQYSPQMKARLKSELDTVDVPLIELT